MEKQKREALVRKAYAEAMSSLRENHKDEFESILRASYDKYGVSVRKRMTAAEAAEAKAAKERIKAERAEQKRLERIARLQAEIEALTEDLAEAS